MFAKSLILLLLMSFVGNAFAQDASDLGKMTSQLKTDLAKSLSLGERQNWLNKFKSDLMVSASKMVPLVNQAEDQLMKREIGIPEFNRVNGPYLRYIQLENLLNLVPVGRDAAAACIRLTNSISHTTAFPSDENADHQDDLRALALNLGRTVYACP